MNLWQHYPMDNMDQDKQRWVAEMNRRVLAGRPTPLRDLYALEAAYGLFTDRWGPPGSRPLLSLPALLADARQALPPPHLYRRV